MNKTGLANDTAASTCHRLPRLLLRSAALALLCGTVQALLPRYPLGALLLAPLSVALGITVAAVLSRGRWTLPAALLGLMGGALATRAAVSDAALEAAITGAQALLVAWLMRRQTDPDLLQFDTWPRLRRFVLQAAPAGAALGVLAASSAASDTAARVAMAPPINPNRAAGKVQRPRDSTAATVMPSATDSGASSNAPSG